MPRTLDIDATASKATFNVKKLGFINVSGHLSGISGTIQFASENLSDSLFDISVPTKSINTDNEKRDEHLRNQDFFSVDQYPEITFKSTTVGQEGGQYFTSGHLSILGATKEVRIPFSFEEGAFEGSFSLNRLDYALGKKFPSFIVGKTIQISIFCKTNP
ncbi:MAG: YceI family protein [Bacteroidota bacterium]